MPRRLAFGLWILVTLVATAVGAADGLEALRDRSSGRMFAIRVTPPAGTVIEAGAPPDAATLRATADAFIADHREMIGIEVPGRDLVASPPETDALGFSRVKYFQKHAGLDVLGGEIAVHMNRAGQVTYVKTKVAQDLPADTTPQFAEAAAKAVALRLATQEARGAVALTVLESRLLVLQLGIIRNDASTTSHLVWEIEVVDEDTRGNKFGNGYYYDAISGGLLLELSRIANFTPITREVYDCGGGSGSTCQLNVESAYVAGYYHGRSEAQLGRGPYPNPPSLPALFYGSTDVDDLYADLDSLHTYYSTTFSINGANGFGGLADWPSVPANITRAAVHKDYTGTDIVCPYGAGFSLIDWFII